MKDVLIVGSEENAIKTYEHIVEVNSHVKTYRVIGFLDDRKEIGSPIYENLHVVGTVSEWTPRPDQSFVLGVTGPPLKRKLVDTLLQKRAKFETIISPKATVSPHANIGMGCVIYPYSHISSGANIGSFVTVGEYGGIGTATIGEYSTVTQFVNTTNAIIGKDVFIGTQSAVLERRRVGDGAFICAGSIVMSHVKPGDKVFGCPARPL